MIICLLLLDIKELIAANVNIQKIPPTSFLTVLFNMATYFANDEDYNTAHELCTSAQNETEFLSMIELQLKASPPPNDTYLTRFLSYAEFAGYTSAIPILLDHPGIPINELTTGPIGDALISSEKAIMMYQSLLHAGWNIDSRMKYQGDALYQAVGKDNKTLVQWLLEHGADPSVNDGFMEHTTLEHAVLKASPPVVALLIEQGQVNPNDCRALEYAAREGKVKTVQVLLNLGAEVNRIVDPDMRVYISPEEDKVGFGSALHRAAEKGRREVVRVLLDMGANPHLRDTKGLTPIDWAKKGWSAMTILTLNRAMNSNGSNSGS